MSVYVKYVYVICDKLYTIPQIFCGIFFHVDKLIAFLLCDIISQKHERL